MNVMSKTDDEPGRELTTHEEVTGVDTPEGRAGLTDALRGLRDLAVQNTATEGTQPGWRISTEERAVGKTNLPRARDALRATESPTIKLAREKKVRDATKNDPQ